MRLIWVCENGGLANPNFVLYVLSVRRPVARSVLRSPARLVVAPASTGGRKSARAD